MKTTAIIIFLSFMALFGCRSKKQLTKEITKDVTSTTEKDSVSFKETITFNDSIHHVPGDSLTLEIPDTTRNWRDYNVENSKVGLSVITENGKTKIKCRCKDLELKVKNQEKTIAFYRWKEKAYQSQKAHQKVKETTKVVTKWRTRPIHKIVQVFAIIGLIALIAALAIIFWKVRK